MRIQIKKMLRIIDVKDFNKKLKENNLYISSTTMFDRFGNNWNIDIVSPYDNISKIILLNDDEDYKYKIILNNKIIKLLKNEELYHYNIYNITDFFIDEDKTKMNIKALQSNPLLMRYVNQLDIKNESNIIDIFIDLKNPLININHYKFIFEDLLLANINKIFNLSNYDYILKENNKEILIKYIEGEILTKKDYTLIYMGFLLILKNNILYIFKK